MHIHKSLTWLKGGSPYQESPRYEQKDGEKIHTLR